MFLYHYIIILLLVILHVFFFLFSSFSSYVSSSLSCLFLLFFLFFLLLCFLSNFIIIVLLLFVFFLLLLLLIFSFSSCFPCDTETTPQKRHVQETGNTIFPRGDCVARHRVLLKPRACGESDSSKGHKRHFAFADVQSNPIDFVGPFWTSFSFCTTLASQKIAIAEKSLRFKIAKY